MCVSDGGSQKDCLQVNMLNFIRNINLFIQAWIKICFVSKWFGLGYKKAQRKSDDVIILANGPSLKTELNDPIFLDRISKMDVICVNYFTDSELFSEVKPKHYVLAAPEYWVDNTTDWHKESRDKMFRKMADEVDWEMCLMIPAPARKKKFWQNILAKNQHIKVVYYNIIPLEGATSLTNWYFKKKLGMPRLHNVLGPSIMSALWLGYKKIYLVGVDHSWIPLVSVTEDNVALVGQPHFYDKDAKPDKMLKGGGETRKLHEILHKFYTTFKGYFVVLAFAKSMNAKIYNMTPGSFIDAFDRISIENFKSGRKES